MWTLLVLLLLQVDLTLLHAGEVAQGIFSGEITAQVYVFTATAGDTVTISMTQAPDSTLDPYLILLGADGQLLAVDDDSGAALPFSAQIESVTLPDDGSYYVIATTFEHLDTSLSDDTIEGEQSYRLLLTGATHQAELLEFTGEHIEIGQEVTGELTEQAPVSWFIFPAEAGRVVDVMLTGDDVDTLLYIFGPDGKRLAVNDDALGVHAAIMDLELPVDGNYLIAATRALFYEAQVDSQKFVLTLK